MSKYFIRYLDSEEAKKVKPDTLYHDEDKEVWVAVNSNEDLNESLFPAEKKLSLRHKEDEELELLNKITLFNFKNALDDYGNSEGKEIILKADPLIRNFTQKMDAAIEKEWQKKSLEVPAP